MDAPKRIWAWPHFDGWITGDWSANTYHDERTVAYILAAEHDRIVAEKDAEIASWGKAWKEDGRDARYFSKMLSAQRIVAEKDAEIARLRHQIHWASEPDFLFGAMDNVHDMGVTLADFADAASRAIRAALENRDANI